jgi:hypothetical protein
MCAPFQGISDFAVTHEFSKCNEKAHQTVKAIRFPVARRPTKKGYCPVPLFALPRSFNFSCRFFLLLLVLSVKKPRLSFPTAWLIPCCYIP